MSDVKNNAKFRTFDPLLWKLGEGWARSLYQLLKLYLRQNLLNTFDGLPLRGCWAWLIDKKERKETPWWVKLKAFPTNVRRPNNQLNNALPDCVEIWYTGATWGPQCHWIVEINFRSNSRYRTIPSIFSLLIDRYDSAEDC